MADRRKSDRRSKIAALTMLAMAALMLAYCTRTLWRVSRLLDAAEAFERRAPRGIPQ
jgi:hypothetical protein